MGVDGPVSAHERVLLFGRDGSEIQPWSLLFRDDQLASCIIAGDANRVLAKLPGESINKCVTSPPYWSLRDYQIDGQIGLEESLEAYLEILVSAFAQVWRLLKPDGTLWLNIGDAYTSGGRTWRAPDKKNSGRAMNVRPPTPEGLKQKDLIGIPWRLAFKLQESGWYLRSDIVWNKPNCQPESVKDRPTKSHEYVFLFSKNANYYYNTDAERGPNDRNLRTVWDISTEANPEAHFATFPTTLVERCLALTSQAGDIVLDPFLGSGTTAEVAKKMRRKFLGIELNPTYVDLASSKLRKLNGFELT